MHTRTLLLFLALLISTSSHAPGSRAGCDSERAPSLLFILADDLGYGDLGSYGQERFETPRLDRLATEGTRFTDAYSGSTVCAPSRCVLMTGMHTGRAFIRGNGKLNLRPEDVTVAEVLQGAGYKTALFGKWGLGHEGTTGLPTRQGFDRFYGYLDQHHAHNYWPTFLIDDEERVTLPNVVPKEGKYGQGKASEKVAYAPDLIFEQTVSWLKGLDDSEPFFLYFSTTIPHANNEAGRKGMEIPELGQFAELDWPEPQKGHAAMITELDRQVGELIDLLGELGRADDTLVIFTSDNGPHREGGNNPDFANSNGDLKGIKRSLHEGGIRVPWIAWWPGTVPAGATNATPVHFADLLATGAGLSGVEIEAPPGTIDLMPVLRGKEGPLDRPLYWEFYEGGSSQAVRFGKWKAIRKPMLSGPIQLYDLEADLGENEDLAKESPEITKRAAELMEEFHEPTERWKVPGKKR